MCPASLTSSTGLLHYLVFFSNDIFLILTKNHTSPHSLSSSHAATSPCTAHSPLSLLILANVTSLCQNVTDGFILRWVWVSWIEVVVMVAIYVSILWISNLWEELEKNTR
ncbi:hypothetical protein DVH24_037205 [Malus domestica]|uniref:Uncharacterized protein n=1 Tax=Malus domestica TaxID=3750 RepID=A0A498HJU8_MALDO|nr:hypothetical protein DVH24_037205 [Malus domestica]